MGDVWRDVTTDDPETVEDAAARFLAAGFSAGVMWYADAPSSHLDDFGEAGAHRNATVLRVAECADTEELASRYVTKDKWRWPRWLARTSRNTQDMVREWSAGHRMSQKRGGPIGEFVTWNHGASFGAAPRRRGSYRAAMALADAKLTGPMEPLLRLYALQEVDQWRVLLRYCMALHLDATACEVAIRRILFARRLRANAGDEAKGNSSAFHAQVNHAEALLRQWLHTACCRFLKAHGWSPETHVEKPATLSNIPKRALPRFMGGIDYSSLPALPLKSRDKKDRVGTGKPAPVRTLVGELAWAYCKAHPAQPRLPVTYRSLYDTKMHKAWDYFHREARDTQIP